MRPAMEQCKTQNQQFLGFFGSMSNYDCSQVEKQCVLVFATVQLHSNSM